MNKAAATAAMLTAPLDKMTDDDRRTLYDALLKTPRPRSEFQGPSSARQTLQRRALEAAFQEYEGMGDSFDHHDIYLRTTAALFAVERIKQRNGKPLVRHVRESIVASALYAAVFDVDLSDMHPLSEGGGLFTGFSVALDHFESNRGLDQPREEEV